MIEIAKLTDNRFNKQTNKQNNYRLPMDMTI